MNSNEVVWLPETLSSDGQFSMFSLHPSSMCRLTIDFSGA